MVVTSDTYCIGKPDYYINILCNWVTTDSYSISVPLLSYRNLPTLSLNLFFSHCEYTASLCPMHFLSPQMLLILLHMTLKPQGCFLNSEIDSMMALFWASATYPLIFF